VTTPKHVAPAPRPRPRGRAVTIPASAIGLNAPIITSPCRLLGYSVSPGVLADPTIAAEVQGVAAAGATLTLTGFLAVTSVTVTPALAWPAVAGVVTVNNVTGGPVIAQIPEGTEQSVVISFSPAAGVSGTPTVVVPALAGGPAYTIEASGLSSLAAADSVGVQATLVDGGQVLMAIMSPPNSSKTDTVGADGIYVGSSVALNVAVGSLTGVIYVLDGWHGGDN
jgi:hypothetical protein